MKNKFIKIINKIIVKFYNSGKKNRINMTKDRIQSKILFYKENYLMNAFKIKKVLMQSGMKLKKNL